MKKTFFLPLLGFLMGACASEDLGNNPQGPANEEEQITYNGYLSISIVPSSGVASRAFDGDTAPGEYEDGTGAENSITMVRFYFFGDGGAAAPVYERKGTGGNNNDEALTQTFQSFIDWYPNAGDVQDNPSSNDHVEKLLHATLGLKYPSGYTDAEGNKHPTHVIAVINPTLSMINDVESYSKDGYLIYGADLDKIEGSIQNYLNNEYYSFNNAGYMQIGSFIMSNSTYVGTASDGSKEKINATPISESNLGTQPEDFQGDTPLKNVLTIYVERVLARLDFGTPMNNLAPGLQIITLSDGTKLYPVGTYSVNQATGNSGSATPDQGQGNPSASTRDDENPTDGNVSFNPADQNFYVKFLGWNVTQTAQESSLIKNINDEWPYDFFGSSPWYWEGFHRSFWAMNPADLEFNYGNFGFMYDQYEGPDALPQTDDNNNPPSLLLPSAISGSGYTPIVSDFVSTYLQENANEYSTGAAAVAPENPTMVIIGAQLTDNTGNPIPLAEYQFQRYTPQGLLMYLAGNVLNGLYTETSNDGQTTRTYIKPEDLMFTSICPQSNVKDPNYYSYVVLSEVGQEKTWYQNGTQFTNTDAVNTYIYDNVPYVRVWNNGMTYYYFTVKHIGDEDSKAEYGIVRNHIYRVSVTNIAGLGTPVFNPNEIIYPEKNQYDESVLSADIKVLQWRVVTEDYELIW